jgi:transcriptional regulator with XRE-family HTH domain
MTMVDLDVGARVRALRKDRGLSLAELSKLTGIAASNLSSIELNKSSPTLHTLLRIAQAFNLKPGALLDEVICPKAVLLRREENRILYTGAPGHSARLITGDGEQSNIDVRIFCIDPEAPPLALGRQPVDLIVYCLSGRLNSDLDGESNELGQGDAVYLPSGARATLNNRAQGQTAEVMLVSIRKLRQEPGTRD